jgi:hypothetical protein
MTNKYDTETELSYKKNYRDLADNMRQIKFEKMGCYFPVSKLQTKIYLYYRKESL